jgi:uncharacterized protein YigE (DUF2233 family)
MISNNAFAWLTLSKGLSFQSVALQGYNPFAKLNAFKIDLDDYQLDIALNNDNLTKLANLKNFAEQEKASLVINGGFFTPQYKPLGLRISNYQQLNELKPISWWGVFYIKKNRAYIRPFKNLGRYKQIAFAVQAGPRLLINSKIPKLKSGKAQRTALGITKENDLIIVTTQNAAISTYELASLMKDQLGCVNALNLDGGSSTQAYAKVGNFEFQTIGYSNISDVIYLSKKT